MKEEDEKNIIKSKNHIYNNSSTSLSLASNKKLKIKDFNKAFDTEQKKYGNQFELKLPEIENRNQNNIYKKNISSPIICIDNLSQDETLNKKKNNKKFFNFKDKSAENQNSNKIQNITSLWSTKNNNLIEISTDSIILSPKYSNQNKKSNLKNRSINFKASREFDMILKDKIKKSNESLIYKEREYNLKPEYFLTADDLELIKEMEKSQKSYNLLNKSNKKQQKKIEHIICNTLTEGRSTGVIMEDCGTQFNFENELNTDSMKIGSNHIAYSKLINEKNKINNKQSMLNNYNFYIGSSLNKEYNNSNFCLIPFPKENHEKIKIKNSNINYSNNSKENFINNYFQENHIGITNLNSINLINFNKFYKKNRELVNSLNSNSDIQKINKILYSSSPLKKSNNNNVNLTLNSKSSIVSKGKITSFTINNKIKLDTFNSLQKNLMNQKDM